MKVTLELGTNRLVFDHENKPGDRKLLQDIAKALNGYEHGSLSVCNRLSVVYVPVNLNKRH